MKGFQIKTLPGLFCWPLAILLLAGPVGAQQPLAQAGGDLPVRAVRQIEALLAAKAQRTPAQRKVSSQFLEAQRTTAQRAVNSQLLDALRTPLREPTAAGTALLQATDPYAKDERVMVDIRADVTPAVLARIQSLGGTVVNSVPKYRAIRARLPLPALEPLATLEAVQFIRPADQPITDQVLQRSDVARAVVATSKVNTSEGDVAHQANVARQTYTVDGTGIGIGVISDGVETLADQQATGDVPGQVFVLPGQEGGSFDLACGGRSSGTEGTALFEIVHDLAPGADLFFATGGGGRAQMAQNIEDLCAAGADIIVDDIGYLGASAFQDDVIAKAITAAAANGCFYFSSAGNAGNLNDATAGVWEGDFANGGTLSLNGLNSGAVVHDFGGGVTGNRIKTNSTRPIILQWADPVDGSANDYDLFLIDADDNVLASSTSTQDGTQDPIEYIGGSCSNDREDNRLVIVKNSGAEDRYLRLNYARGGLEIATAGQTFGHSASKDAIGVAAVDVGDAGGAGGVFDGTESVETFSSDGLRRIFFEADGTPITAGNFLASTDGGRVLQKPDLAAADGVSTSTPGFSTFRGTSAAAPHAAAIAALMLEAAGGPANVTPAALRTAMTGAALDIEATGVDRDSGAGIVMAPGAVDAVDVAVADRNGAPTVSGTISDRAFAPGDAALTIDLTSVFSDPDNDTLTYTVWSSDNARLSVSAVTGTSFTLTPVSPGRMVVAVVAADPEGLIAVLTFGVTVTVSNETPDTTSPEVSSLAITSNPGGDQTYAVEDGIEVTVTFSETVEVTGTPQLRLRVGSSNRTAAYLRGTDTEELVFGYEVADGHEDTDGVSIEAGQITLNGGTIEDEADNPAELAHEAVAAQAGHKVDGVRPVFVSAAVDGSSLTLTYGETLDGGSRPAPGDFTVEVDGAGRSVTGVSVSGSVVTLTLSTAVEHGDTGIRVSYTPGTNPIQDAVGNDARGLSNQAVTNTTGAPNTAPEITTVGPFTVRENQALVGRLAARDDDSGDEVTGWSIMGGADQSQFSITSDTGDLSFQEAPDYESPTDVLSGDPPSGAGDNEYVVTVEVRSGAGARELEAEQTFTLRVTDEREPPGIPEAPAFSGETADSLTVRWSEPENTGPPIMDYDVRYREKGPGHFIDAQYMGPGLSLTLADLEPGTAYEVQVRATNDEGTSDWSDPGEGMTVTPLTVEMMGGTEPPVEGPFTVRFSFSEPVRGFTQAAIEAAQDPACTDEQNNPVFCEPDIGRLETVDDRVFSTTVTPQTDRVAHNYTLTLTVSEGAVRSSVGNKLNEEAMLGGRVAPPGVTLPISEIGLRASGLDRVGRLNWNRPTNDGGSPIIRYEHRHAPVGEVWNDWENVGARATGVTVGNLVNGLEYVFEVRAVNALGKGPVETAAAIPVLRTGPPPGGGGGGGGGPLQTVPDAPTNLLAVGGDSQVVLTWDAPEGGGGLAITDYEYRIDQTGEWISIGSTDTTHTVTGLTNGTAYVFQVRAVNEAGNSAPSNRVEATPMAAVTLLVANFSNGNNGAFNSRVYLWNPSTSAGQVTVRVFTLPLTTGIAQELTGPPLDLGTLEARSALNLKLVEDILDPLGIALPYTTDGGNLTLEFTIEAPDVKGVAQVFSSDFAFGTYPLQEIPSTSSGSPTVLVANFTNGNNGALHSRVYLWNPSATDGQVTARVFTLPNTGDSMRLQTVPLGILKAFSARNIRIAEDILGGFLGIALPYTDDGGNLMLEFTIEAPDVKGAAQVFSSDFAFGTYPMQEIPSTSSGSPTVLVANFTNGNNGALHSRVYLWNPSASAGEVTVRVFTLPQTGNSSLLGTLDLESLQAESARNLKLAEDILAPLGIALPYVTDGGNLTLEFTIQAADARGVAQVFSSDFAFGTYPMQEIPSTSSGSPTVLVANFMNGNDAALNSRVYLWNPSLSAGSVTVRVFTLPLTGGLAQELTTAPLDLGTLGAESARNLKLVEDILTPLGIPTPYVTDGGNLTLEFTIQAADVRGAAQVFSSSFAFGTVPLQVIQ